MESSPQRSEISGLRLPKLRTAWRRAVMEERGRLAQVPPALQMTLLLHRRSNSLWREVANCLTGVVAVVLITWVCFLIHRKALTPMSLYLIVVVLLSLRGRFLSSIVVSTVAMLCLDYFFVPPLFSLVVSDPLPFITFLISSAVITRLVSRVGKLLKEKLQQSEAYLSEAQRLSHTGSFGWQASAGVLVWSEETFRIFEYEPTMKPTVQMVIQRTHPEDLALVERTIRGAAQDGKGFDFEHRLLMPDGSVKHLHIAAHATGTQSGKFEFIGSVMDITESKRAQEALRQAQAELAHITRMTTMGELAASIAHEVNQPLAAVIMNGNGGLRWLAGNSPNLDEAREALKRIVRDGSRAGEVIARIRALLKKAAPAKQPMDLNEAIREVIILTQNAMDKNRVALRLELPPDLPHVFGDRVQLQQVILNLIINAIDAMGTVEDRVRDLFIRTQRGEEGEVFVTVRDSGIGLDFASMEQVFTAFHTTKPSGLGMGLSISRSIVENHSGRLWVTAHDGAGASFHFTLFTAPGTKS
jgi:signal transduction histidine kinase